MRRKVKRNQPDYQTLRARLLEKGLNLRTFARQRDYPVTTVYGAARGIRSGIKATRIRKELEQLAK